MIEFQHSPISVEECEIRTLFYGNIFWVVDGLKRKRDQGKFLGSLTSVTAIFNSPFVGRIFTLKGDGGPLFRDWSNCQAPVLFDFNNANLLWCLLPGKDQERIVAEISRSAFIYFILTSTKSEDHFLTLLIAIEKLAAAYRIRKVGLGTEINNLNAVSSQLAKAINRKVIAKSN